MTTQDASLASPSRSVKRTYAGRAKRKDDDTAYKDEDASNGSMSEHEVIAPVKAVAASKSAKRAASGMKPPSSTARPNLPGPPPSKRVRASLGDSPKGPSKDKSMSHHRNSSSISSTVVGSDGRPTPSKSSKPLPFAGTKLSNGDSLKKDRSPETDMDDNASIAESTKSTRVRRTEAERKAIFAEDPQCGDIEPHRAKCTRCRKWVNLGKQQTYTVRTWESHRKKCDARSPRSPDEDDDADEVASVAPSVAPSMAQSERVGRKSETERKEYLTKDERAEQVEEHEALCKRCQKWIKLSPTTKYSLSNWLAHQVRCSGDNPSNRVTVAERRLKMVNDKLAKTYTTHSVECAGCGTTVTSESNAGDYDLSEWEVHKARCPSLALRTSPSQKLVSAASTSCAAVNSPSPLPPSVESDATVVAGDSSPQGLKRAREDDQEMERPSSRPRDETYKPAAGKLGPFGWLFAPFRTFARGFEEGWRGAQTE